MTGSYLEMGLEQKRQENYKINHINYFSHNHRQPFFCSYRAERELSFLTFKSPQ